MAERIGELVADTREPESLPRLAEQHRVVFQNGDVHAGERAAHAVEVVPPIVIAEDRPGAERRTETREFGRPERVRHALGREPVPGDEIAEQDNEIGLQPIGGVDHVANVRERHVGPAGVEVRDHRNRELAARRPAGRGRRIAGDNEALRLDRAGVNGGCGRG